MGMAAQDAVIKGRVQFRLADLADGLTCNDLLKITKIAEEAGAVVQISPRSWHVLIGAPVIKKERVIKALRAVGYASVNMTDEIDQQTTFELGGK